MKKDDVQKWEQFNNNRSRYTFGRNHLPRQSEDAVQSGSVPAVYSQAKGGLLEHHHLAGEDFKESYINNSSALIALPARCLVGAARSARHRGWRCGLGNPKTKFNRRTLKGGLDNTRAQNQERKAKIQGIFKLLFFGFDHLVAPRHLIAFKDNSSTARSPKLPRSDFNWSLGRETPSAFGDCS